MFKKCGFASMIFTRDDSKCRQSFVWGRMLFIFSVTSRMSLLMCMWTGTTKAQSFGSIRSRLRETPGFALMNRKESKKS